MYGSVDSQLTPEDLAAAARSSGLTGCCITEHNSVWERYKAVQEGERWGVPFIRGMEVSTNLGHIVVYGLGQYVSGIHDAEQLRKVVDAEAGIMIAAHPFRNLHQTTRFARSAAEPEIPTIAEAAAYPLFGLVDDIEVFNAGTGESENLFALAVARHLGLRGIASSDAHSTHGIGRFVTVFEGEVASTGELIAAIRSRRYYPARLEQGRAVDLNPNPASCGTSPDLAPLIAGR